MPYFTKALSTNLIHSQPKWLRLSLKAFVGAREHKTLHSTHLKMQNTKSWLHWSKTYFLKPEPECPVEEAFTFFGAYEDTLKTVKIARAVTLDAAMKPQYKSNVESTAVNP